MKQIIELKNIYAASTLYTRSKAAELTHYINTEASEVTLDFGGIDFLSRSFADEVCNLIEDHNRIKFHFANCNDVVETMLSRVTTSRTHERRRGLTPPQMLEFDTLESLAEFLATPRTQHPS